MESIEFAVGVTFLFLGISLIFRQREWIGLIEYMESRGLGGMLAFGAFNTVIGSSILGFHWEWHGISIITTIIGMLFLLRGFICLTYPAWALAKIKRVMKRAQTNLKIAAIASILVGGIVLHNWWLLQYGWLYGYQPDMEFNDVFRIMQ